jgi:hypothetical protein
MPRSTNPYELSFRSRLGKAAVIGGLKRVEQEAARALPIVLTAGLDAGTISRMFKTFRTIADQCERSAPLHDTPSPDRRVKVRWTSERIAQFKRDAPWCKDNRALAQKLGLPEFCAGAMRAARSRYGVAATRCSCSRRARFRPATCARRPQYNGRAGNHRTLAVGSISGTGPSRFIDWPLRPAPCGCARSECRSA